MKEWKPVDQDTFQNLLTAVNAKDKKLLEYIYKHRICKLSTLMEKFPGREDSLIDFITGLGGVNGKIFKKFSCAIYPKQPAHTLKDSGYSLGLLV